MRVNELELCGDLVYPLGLPLPRKARWLVYGFIYRNKWITIMNSVFLYGFLSTVIKGSLILRNAGPIPTVTKKYNIIFFLVSYDADF